MSSILCRGSRALVDGVLVIKFGGSVTVRSDGGDPVLRDLLAPYTGGRKIALVHGGGPEVDAELRARGMPIETIGGLRVTDAATLEVVCEVVGRRVNPAIVVELIADGGRAQGIGGDEGVFLSSPGSHPGGDLGFLGEVERVETGSIPSVIESGMIPVISPIGIDAGGRRYNLNDDPAAGALAVALGAAAYIIVTNVQRVRLDRNDPESGIARLKLAEAEAYLRGGVFTDGMLPKVNAALGAVRNGVPRVIITGCAAGAISAALAGDGTEFVA